MSTATAKIATVQSGYCDACEHPFVENEGVHEFVFASRSGSFVAQYATCGLCHQVGREEGTVSAPPLRVLVSGPPKFNFSASTCRSNSAAVRCTLAMGEFFACSAIEARFPEDAAA